MFVTTNATKWSRKAQQNTAGWVHQLASWTRAWSQYRRRHATAAESSKGTGHQRRYCGQVVRTATGARPFDQVNA